MSSFPTTDLLQRAKSLFIQKDGEYAWVGNFPSLHAEIHLERIKYKLKNEQFNHLNLLTTYIIQDIWNICTIISRLSWMREKACQEDYLRQMWMYYVSVDISLFHIEIKSIMDYVAEIIAKCANKQILQEYIRKNAWLNEPNNYSKLKGWKDAPQKFAGLKQWLKEDVENRRHQSISTDIAGIIESTLWYDEISLIRNELVHKGDHVIVYGKPEERILFQIIGDGYERCTINDFYIVENNIASFEKYAALYMSHLLLFLEKFAGSLRQKFLYTGDIRDTRMGSPGFDILIKWIDEAMVFIERRKTKT